MTDAIFRHPIVSAFALVEPHVDGPFHVNAIGARARDYFPNDWFAVTDALQPNEELFEWLDILEAVQTSGERVTVVDIGAGYGRWLVNAALAARQKGKPTYLVGVEAEPTHHAWMLEHFRDNGISPDEFKTYPWAVSDAVREVVFVEGASQEWYGQAIIPALDHAFGEWQGAKLTILQSMPASAVFEGLELVDALHIDIQGEEGAVVPALMNTIDQRVRRVHIGTHSTALHEQIGSLFSRSGWEPRRVIPFMSVAETEFGEIRVNDGLQSWSNPRIRNPTAD